MYGESHLLLIKMDLDVYPLHLQTMLKDFQKAYIAQNSPCTKEEKKQTLANSYFHKTLTEGNIQHVKELLDAISDADIKRFVVNAQLTYDLSGYD